MNQSSLMVIFLKKVSLFHHPQVFEAMGWLVTGGMYFEVANRLAQWTIRGQ